MRNRGLRRKLDEAAERVCQPHLLDRPAVRVEQARRAHQVRKARRA